MLQDRDRRDVGRFSRALQDLLAEARKRPEIGFVFANFDARVPQIEYEVNRDKVKTLGVALSDVFFTLQTFLGGYYVNDFNLYGRTFRVQAQADGAQRTAPEDIDNVLRAQHGERRHGAAQHGGADPTRSTGRSITSATTCIARRRSTAPTRRATAPGKRSRRWKSSRAPCPKATATSGASATYQEKKTGGQTGYIFALSLVFVFLVLAALYESWAMPIAILLVIPFGVVGAFLGLRYAASTTTSTRRSA